MDINTTMRDFVSGALDAFDRIAPLEGDASTREYFRVHSGQRTCILCRDGAAAGTPVDGYPFAAVHGLLHDNGVPVPAILAMDMENGLILQEDAGDDLIETVLPSLSRRGVIDIYARMVDIAVDIQSIRGDGTRLPFNLAFDIDKLMFEFGFFIEHALKGYFHASMTEAAERVLREAFLRIAGELYRPELFVLNHRDYHSRNVMTKGGALFVIDFQDARMGLPHYDIVSLVRDSYCVLDDDIVGMMMTRHFDALRDRGLLRMSRDEYDRLFDLMAFQRNVKAVGTFGYQVGRLGKRRYESSIPTTLGYLPAYVSRRPELAAAYDIIRENIGARA